MEIEDVFNFFSNPENLKNITPDSLSFKIITPKPINMSKGILLDYTIKLFRFPIHWRTYISDYDPPNYFVDQQIKGPYRFWHHTHIFKKVDGGVEIIDKIKYSVPFGYIGRIINTFWIRNDLNKIFDYRKKMINKILKKD